MQDFIAKSLGDQFIEPQTTDLSLVYKDSSPTTPLIFVLSTGTDPAADLYAFAEVKFCQNYSGVKLNWLGKSIVLCDSSFNLSKNVYCTAVYVMFHVHKNALISSGDEIL